MKKNEKNKVILGLATQEPRNSAESKKEKHCHSEPQAENPGVKALSFLRLRGASGAQGIFAPARVLFKHLSCRFFNLIRRSLEFFRIMRKNRDDSLLFLASPRTCFGEIATSASRLLAMTPITLTLAAVLSIGIISESRADCPAGIVSCGDNCNKTSNGYTATGSNCKWSITDEGVLIVERIDKTQPASTGSYMYGAPWSYSGVKAVILDGVVTNQNFGVGMATGGIPQKFLTINGGSLGGSLGGLGFNGAQIESCTGNDASACLVEKGFSKKCGSGKFLQGKSCVSSCGASFRLNDGECDRIRYTPAEAAQYLKDTDNTIIMTFKVNR